MADTERKILKYWSEAKGICDGIRSRGGIEFSTGFRFLDDATGGLQPGDIWVISGRPGIGKTAFVLNLAQKLADNPQHRVLFCSLEMQGYELALRMFCEMTGTSYLSYMTGKNAINPEHDLAFQKFLRSINFEIEEYGYTFEEVIKAIENNFGGKKPDVVFIDYIQLIDWSRTGDERVAISLYSRQLAELAKTKRIALVIASQLRRPPAGFAHDRPPELSDLKGSGSIEQDAHKVIFLYRTIENEGEPPKYYANLAKNRQGPAPVTEQIGYDGKCYRFFDLQDDPKIQELQKTFGGEIV